MNQKEIKYCSMKQEIDEIYNFFNSRLHVQEGLEELLYRYTEGECHTNYLWSYGDEWFADWMLTYGDEIFDMVNLRCGPTCEHYDNATEKCTYCDIPDGNYNCSACADIPINMMQILLGLGLKHLLCYAQTKHIDYRLVYEVIEVYGKYYEEGKWERLTNDILIADRWMKLVKKVYSKIIMIGVADNGDKIMIKNHEFEVHTLDGEVMRTPVLDDIITIAEDSKIDWNMKLLENFEQLYKEEVK